MNSKKVSPLNPNLKHSKGIMSLVLIFPVVTLTVFVVGIIRIDLAKFQQKHVSGKEEE